MRVEIEVREGAVVEAQRATSVGEALEVIDLLWSLGWRAGSVRVEHASAVSVRVGELRELERWVMAMGEAPAQRGTAATAAPLPA